MINAFVGVGSQRGISDGGVYKNTAVYAALNDGIFQNRQFCLQLNDLYCVDLPQNKEVPIAFVEDDAFTPTVNGMHEAIQSKGTYG